MVEIVILMFIRDGMIANFMELMTMVFLAFLKASGTSTVTFIMWETTLIFGLLLSTFRYIHGFYTSAVIAVMQCLAVITSLSAYQCVASRTIDSFDEFLE